MNEGSVCYFWLERELLFKSFLFPTWKYKCKMHGLCHSEKGLLFVNIVPLCMMVSLLFFEASSSPQGAVIENLLFLNARLYWLIFFSAPPFVLINDENNRINYSCKQNTQYLCALTYFSLAFSLCWFIRSLCSVQQAVMWCQELYELPEGWQGALIHGEHNRIFTEL